MSKGDHNKPNSDELRGMADKQHDLEKRIIRDLIVCTLAVIVFSALAYFLNLLEMLAEMFDRPELREIDTITVVIIYAVWAAGIFVLRRLYELKSIAADRRQLVEQLHSAQKTETVERMASGMSHDFKNVLTIISGLVELCLMEEKINDSTRENLLKIKQSVKKASSLIKQLMTLGSSRLEISHHLDLNKEVLEMESLLRSLIGPKIELRTVLDPQLATITGEKHQIDEILLNLIKNAMDAVSAMDAARGVITISTTNTLVDDQNTCRILDMKPGNYVLLSVEDNGYGIDPAIIPHIFEPYFTTKAEGTGLGLAMVMSLVKQNGGRIDVKSELRKGSVFKIFFPATSMTTKVIEFAEQEKPATELANAAHQA